MSQTSPTPNQRLVTELKVSAHLMLLDPGLFCVFHTQGAPLPDPASGLPGVRISPAPSNAAESLSISTFDPDGWLGEGGAALVRVSSQPSQVLVTIYQAMNSTAEAPKLQVLRLSETGATRQAPAQPAIAAPSPDRAAASRPAVAPPAAGAKLEVAAHVQRRGDVLTRLGEWMGERGSQSWIEGFAISPARFVDPADIEYQAVLGKGWLSPWSEGGSYCGSRGMALPILGLRVRLKGEAAERYEVRVSASFTDGSSVGPVDDTQTAESAELAPLEAFLVEILPRDGVDAEAVDAAGADASQPADAARRAAARPQRAVQPAAKPQVAQPVAAKRADPAPRPTAKPAPKSAPAPLPARGAATARPGLRGGPAGKSGAKGRR